jgi:hypothetical protein
MVFSNLDFYSKSAIRAPWTSSFVGGGQVRRQVGFRPTDRELAAADVSSLCRALRGKTHGQALQLPRAVQAIVLSGFYSDRGFQTPRRRIRFKAPNTGKRPIFVTNSFSPPVPAITEVYRSRWQVGHHQKTFEHLSEPLRNATDIEPVHV